MKKNLLSKAFLSVTSAILMISFFSCKVGMGQSVDLEAPVVKITSPSNMDFVHKTFTIYGEATDNRHVESIEIEYQYQRNGETIKNKITLSGNNLNKISKTPNKHKVEWSHEFNFDGDYAVTIEVFAYDEMRATNTSEYSHQRIMVLIDSETPNIGSMQITRNGKYISKLVPLSYFTMPETGKTAKKDKAENKDYFQNENFTLSTNLTDNYEIEKVYMELFEIDAETEAETLVLGNIEPDSSDNLYAPSFSLTEEKIVEAAPSLKNGLHYLKPYVYAKDAAGNKQEANEYGVFAWYPEYNTPHISFNTLKDGLIEVIQGAPIIATVFDDDDIKTFGYTLVKLDTFEAGEIENFDPSKASTPHITTLGDDSGLRDTAIEVITEDKKEGGTVIETAEDFEGNAITLGRYYLVVKVEDDSGRTDGISFFATEVKIKNEDAPTVFVDSPEENSVPNLSDNKFTISGTVSDNEPGVKIAIAWLGSETSPENTTTKIRDAETYFENNYKFTADETYKTGKIWYLGSGTQSGSGNSYSYAWSKEFDFFADYFKNGTDTDNTNKVFVIAAKDPTGNVTPLTFRMSKFTSKPSFEIKYTYDSDPETALNSPILEKAPGKQVVFKITPKTQNNMPIVECYITEGGTEIATWSTTNTTCIFTISAAEAKSGLTKNYKLYAKDKIGGVSEQNLTVRFAEEGKLESVTCTRNSGTTFTAGETIKLQANFSSKVTLNVNSSSNKPYIKLNGTFKDKNDETITTEQRAYHKTTGTTEGSTLYFEYDIPDDIEATDITIPLTSTIVLNGSELSGDISTVLTADKSINNSAYTIDSIAPYIKKMTPAKNGVVKKEDGSITLSFEFNEPVWVESGTIVMQRTDNWYIPPVLSKEVFEKIWNAASADDKIKLCGSSTELFTYRNDPNATNDSSNDKNDNDKNTMIPAGPYMQYTNGLIEGSGYGENAASRADKTQTGSMIPDLETKYVLDYSYNISSTTGDVKNLREVLETHEYHKATFDVTSVRGENGVAIPSTGSNIITLTITDENFIDDLINGVEYFLTLTPDSFRDKAYNYYKGTVTDGVAAGIPKDEYTFWVGPVATPVIRVDRIATNGTTGNENKPETKGKTTFKIDCVTPGATIDYGVSTRTLTGKTTTTSGGVERTYLQDITKTVIEGTLFTQAPGGSGIAYKSGKLTNLSGSSDNIEIGDGLGTTAQKIAIRAMASKTGDMADSPYGFEGAFKTVLHYKYSSSKTYLQIFGCQEPEGSSYTAGWPLTQNGRGVGQRKEHQYAYKTGNDFYWVSWQILSDFTLQTYTTNY